MSADVFTYKPNGPLQQHLNAMAFNPTGVQIAYQRTGPINAPEWGAKLRWQAVGPVHIYELLVRDPTSKYAPFHAANLNGSHPNIINAILFPLPPKGPGFSPPRDPGAAVADFVRGVGQWSPSQQNGVIALSNTFEHLSDIKSHAPEIHRTTWLDRILITFAAHLVQYRVLTKQQAARHLESLDRPQHPSTIFDRIMSGGPVEELEAEDLEAEDAGRAMDDDLER